MIPKHIQIRAKIVIESVINKEKYLNHEYLSQGVVQVNEDVTLPEIYSMFSGQNTAGLSDNIVESVYEKEILSLTKIGSYMGICSHSVSQNRIEFSCSYTFVDVIPVSFCFF